MYFTNLLRWNIFFLQKMNISNKNEQDLKVVSGILLSDTVQMALTNALNEKLDVESPNDIKGIKKGLMETFKRIGNMSNEN